MKVEIISDEAVSRNILSKDKVCACAFTQATAGPNGTAYASYRSGTGKHGCDGVFQMQRSTDQGKTWSEPVIIYDQRHLQPQHSVLCGCIGMIEGTLFAAYTVVKMNRTDVYVFSDEAKAFPWYLYLSCSNDGGATWSEPREINTSPLSRVTPAAKPFPLAEGGFCLPLEFTTEAGPQGTAGIFSHDKGQTFSRPKIFASDDDGKLSLCDARFNRLQSGTYLMHLWAFLHEGEKTLLVHQGRSLDGKIWTKPSPIGIHGQISSPLGLASGLVIAVSNHRHPPEGNQLWWSLDEGRTWNDHPVHMWDVATSRVTGQPAASRVVSEQENVWDELQKFSFGTPDLLLLDDGTVLLLYYATLEGIIHVRACHFRVHV